ncbi:MAG: CDP-glycerol glycerophosphotransferase family protein [Bacteroidetes bacterium]|nr:CDP-glycerol glycerophosphotransferase family protein [Bacteroidota bacterium]
MKKRVAVTISFSFSIRYLVRTGMIDAMREFCEPVICIFWQQPDLIEELNNKGFEVHVIPESKRGLLYTDTRLKLDYWFRLYKLKSPTYKVEPRYIEKFKPLKKVIIGRLREYYNNILFTLSNYKNKLLKKDEQYLVSDTNYNEMINLVKELNIDAVFTVTPFHAQEEIFLRAVNASGKKMMTSILSFDNVIKRGWLTVNYSCYMVWNKYNANEVKRIYTEAMALNNNNVHIVGAPQFDFYHQPQYIMPRKEWLQLVGLPDNVDRKIILFAGGPVSLFPQEPQFLQHIDDAISEGLIEGNPIILFRCHPIDRVERWKQAIKNPKNIYFDSSWNGTTKLTYANVTDTDIAKLCSTLYYTDVHVNTSSTMTVDGSAYKKPQIGPGYDEVYPNSRYPILTYYYQEYYLPIMQTNGLSVAMNRKELINYVNDALKHPENYIQKCRDIVLAITTYDDGMNKERVLNVLKEELTK